MVLIMEIIDKISVWSGRIFSFLAVFVVGVITYDVVARYVFNAPTTWGMEVQYFTCGIYYVMGGAYTLYLKQHVKIDVVYNYLSPRMQAIMDLVTSPLLFLYLGVLVWAGSDIAWGTFVRHETTGSTFSPPVWPLTMSLPIGAFLMLLQGLSKFMRDLNIARTRPTAVKDVVV
jgi:TRAP-type mannitol/chloroaromatic compound transport system permease small subunit